MSSTRRRFKEIETRERVPVEDSVTVTRRHPKTIVRELQERIDNVIITNRRRFGIYPRKKIVA